MIDCGVWSSVDRLQFSHVSPSLAVAAEKNRPGGELGGVVSATGGSVVTTTGSLTGERLPEKSRARKVNEYVVLG